MAVTSQQIADAAGVSRATVDRALKDRGRVRPEVAERIKKIAKEMGYHPNQAARMLALSKQHFKIGVLLSSMQTPFMQEVLKGVRDAKEEVEKKGVIIEIRTTYGKDVHQTIAALDELKQVGVRGIALVPTDDEKVKKKINQLTEEDNISVVTLNADVSKSKRICFVGQDNNKAGRTAAGLMAECLPANSQVCVIGGLELNPAIPSRTNGFIEGLRGIRPDIEIVDSLYVTNENDNKESEKIALKMIEKYPDLGGVYVSPPVVLGVCRAMRKKRVDKKIKLISHDLLQENLKQLEEGTINFLIGQEGYMQGYEPIMILFRLLVEERNPEKEFEYTSIIIKNRFNI
ncbi:LacI family transcriptional regulator [Aequitasia blattaphilus]|uniref:LacI family DNA-binding transcriptional regulator n=1 Tax=Aequitasia blattaphilus TaxID=2949332 RepID=A0ABT1E9Y6_9FIRM|nr:LacI family DNA-binding transcriptional regulator [Aequitasia blattaphilus]MCP1102603.1 LacI family DNA-binding transcriptional regulator [Aequitasia blattaphilus]MCR8615243.1 LacI family DNA-binding transcriptional regulator [Aequitasia blattaphilus]